MGKATIAASTAVAIALHEAGLDDEAIEIVISEPEPIPDFKLARDVRADPAFGRERTHPTTYRKRHG